MPCFFDLIYLDHFPHYQYRLLSPFNLLMTALHLIIWMKFIYSASLYKDLDCFIYLFLL